MDEDGYRKIIKKEGFYRVGCGCCRQKFIIDGWN